MSNELMHIYMQQTSQSFFSEHTDHHNDADCYYGGSGDHDDYSYHSDSDDDRDYW